MECNYFPHISKRIVSIDCSKRKKFWKFWGASGGQKPEMTSRGELRRRIIVNRRAKTQTKNTHNVMSWNINDFGSWPRSDTLQRNMANFIVSSDPDMILIQEVHAKSIENDKIKTFCDRLLRNGNYNYFLEPNHTSGEYQLIFF